MILQRSHYQIISRRINEPRRFIQVLFGPRQVGKTTLIKQLIEDIKTPYHSISADVIPNSNPAWIEQQWTIAREKFSHSGASDFLLVIDEIQKIGNWSEMVKRLWDEDTKGNLSIKVILLGSSRLLLQQGLTESLAGRFETIYMGHWSFREMKDAFHWTVEQFVWFGGYPASAGLIDDEERWKKYITDSLIETSISKDILMLTRVDKPALMRKLFELGCLYSGQILSFTKMVGQLHEAGNTTTLSHYLDLLNTAGLLDGLEKFTPDQIRKRGSSPKFQVHNTALISSQRNEDFVQAVAKPELWGRLVESSVGAHLINHSLVHGFNVHYWRHRNDEIDFVIEKRGVVIGLEIKSGATQKASGMEAFKKTFQPDKMLLIGNTGMSWQEFLEINPNQLF